MAGQEGGGGERCLVSLQDGRPLAAPLAHSSKIKYTCVCASERHIALGANTGGIYCFHREGLSYIRILANREGSVSLLQFAPGGELLAAVCGGGHVAFWELHLHEQGVSKRFHVSSQLKEGTVREMVWDGKGARLFYGDDQGRIAVAKVSKGSLFKKVDDVIFQSQDKAPIVQMDVDGDRLLISTTSRSLLLHLPSRQTVQVGRRPRDGPFGACFHPRRPGGVVYSARPGGRLWEANLEGGVVSTLRLRDLVTVPPTPIYGAGFTPSPPSPLPPSLSLSLPRLSILSSRLMVGLSDGAVFLFDPAHLKLVAWSCDVGRVTDWYCHGRQLFVLGEGVRVVSLVTPSECLQELVNFGYLEQTRLLLDTYSEHFAERLPASPRLCPALSTALEFAKSLTPNEELSETLQLLRSAVEELRGKHDKNSTSVGPARLDEVAAPPVSPPASGPQEPEAEEKVNNGFSEVDLHYSEYDDPPPELDVDNLAPEVNENSLQLSDSKDRGPSPFVLQDNIGFDEYDGKNFTDELDLDATLIPDNSTELEKSSNSTTSLTLETQIVADSAKVDSTNTEIKTAQMTAFPESSGIEIPQRPHSIAVGSHSQSSEPDIGVSVGSSLDSGSKPLHNDTKSPDALSLSTSAEKQSGSLNLTRNKSDLTQRVASALRQAATEDDIIAVPVVRTKGKKKSSKRSRKGGVASSSPGRRFSSPDIIPITSDKTSSASTTLPTLTPSPHTSLPTLTSSPHTSLLNIPEEILPFPEAGLPTPPTMSRQSTAPASLSTSPLTTLTTLTPSPTINTLTEGIVGTIYDEPDSNQKSSVASSLGKDSSPLEEGSVKITTALPPSSVGGSILGFQKPVKPSELLSKVKSLAKQRGVSMEPEALQEKMKKVKGIFASLANPQPSYSHPGSHDLSQNQRVFLNDDFSAIPEVEMSLEQQRSPVAVELDSGGVGADDQAEVDPEVTAFLESTAAVIAQLEEPAIFCCPAHTKQVLQGWLAKLHRFKQHCSSPSTTHSQHLTTFQQPHALLANSNCPSLLSLCFELGVCSQTDEDEGTPIQFSLAEFLRAHYPLFEFPRLSAALQMQGSWAVRRASWEALVGGGAVGVAELQGAREVVARLEEGLGGSDVIATPALLARLFEADASAFTQFCIKAFPAVSPWEVAMVTGIDPDPNTPTTPHPVRYAEYLNTLMVGEEGEGGTRKEEVSAIFKQDPVLLVASLSALLSGEGEGEEGGLKDSLSESNAATLKMQLLDLLLCADLEPAILQQARDICRGHCYWLGVVQLLVSMGDKRGALSLLVRLRDVSLLVRFAGELLTDLDDWKLLLMIMCDTVDQEPVAANSTTLTQDPTTPATTVETSPTTSHNASEPTSLERGSNEPPATAIEKHDQRPLAPVTQSEREGNELTWYRVLVLMLQHLSPGVTNQLINEVAVKRPLDGRIMHQQLHSILVRLTAIHTEKRALAHALLEKVDRYLWNPRPSALGPQLIAVQTREEGEAEGEGDALSPLLSSFAPPCVRSSLEDTASHWGVAASASSARCGCCKLSLLHTVSELHRGVLLFHCGHGFHTCCLPEQACVLCFTANMQGSTAA